MRKQKDDQKECTTELETKIANQRNLVEAGQQNNGSTSRGNEELLRIRSNLIKNNKSNNDI